MGKKVKKKGKKNSNKKAESNKVVNKRKKTKKFINKKTVLASLAVLVTVAVVVGVLYLFEDTATKIIDDAKLNYSVVFSSPFQNSDESTGSSKLDEDGITTYFMPYRNHLSKGTEEINNETVNSKPWAIWGLLADELEIGGKYRVSMMLALDDIPQDPSLVVAEINTHQTGLTEGHHICETINDITKEITAGDFSKENEFIEVVFDFEYKEVKDSDIIHNHSQNWSAFDGTYDVGKVELRVGWEDESVGLKIKEVSLKRLNRKLKSVSITPPNNRIPLNKNYNIKYSVTPEDASASDIKWSSSNEKVADVRNGMIVPKSVGKATLSYAIEAGNSGNFEIEVYMPLEEIVIDTDEKLLKAGEGFNLNTTLKPNGADSDIKWTSSNENIATVKAGEVKALSNGITTIKAEAQGREATCTVYVSDSFKDVIAGENIEDWAYEAITAVCAKGIMTGIDIETFNPMGNISRKEFLLSFAKLLGYQNELAGLKAVKWPFADEVNSEYKDAILYLYKENIFNGISKNKKLYVEGDSNIERQEALGLLGKTIDRDKEAVNEMHFSDSNETNKIYIEDIKNIISNGIKISKLVNGNECLKPTEKLTRQEAADFFIKLDINIVNILELEGIKVFLDKENNIDVLKEKLSQKIPVEISYHVVKLLSVEWNKADTDKIGNVGMYKITGKVRFRNEIKEVSSYVKVEDFIEDKEFGEIIYAGNCESKEGSYKEDGDSVIVLPVGRIPGETGDGDHGVWSANIDLAPGRYIVNFVIQVDKSTANDKAKKGAQIARINPAFDSGEIELQLRSITLDNFDKSNVWYNINCEFVMPEGSKTIELRLWYNNNVTMKVREIEVYGVSKILPKERAGE